MGYRYLVIGSGVMGSAIVYDLLLNPETEKVTAVDYDLEKAQALVKQNDDPRLDAAKADAAELSAMTEMMRDYDVAIGAASYTFNLTLTKAAIAAKTHYCDLGGNNDVVEAQCSLDEKARAQGVMILPGCGIAPGAVSIITAYGLEQLGTPEQVDYVKIRVGGLPQHPKGKLKYALVFSAQGLVNECKEPAEILRDGKTTKVKSMTELETLEFPQPFGILEAVHTSGGASTLTRTLAKGGAHKTTVNKLDYKTLRYPGTWDQMIQFEKEGKFKEEHRKEFEAYLEKTLPHDKEDALIMRISIGHEGKELVYELITTNDPNTGHTAMQRTTGYTASIIAQMLADGRIKRTGVLYKELDVPVKLFRDAWKKRGILLEESST